MPALGCVFSLARWSGVTVFGAMAGVVVLEWSALFADPPKDTSHLSVEDGTVIQ